ncbi:uncharacterized protein [Apostichopus japonicus]
MSTTDPCVVVVGEASETDSEDEEIEHPPHVRPQLASSSDKGGVVVQGEASETDSDDEPVQVKSRQQSPESLLIHADFPPLKVEALPSPRDASSSSPDTTSLSSLSLNIREGLGAPKYDTLIHHNLRDKNASLLINIYDSVGGALTEVSRTVYSANQQMHRSQIVIQDVCQLIKNFCKDLDLVTQKLDVINTTQYIPTINIPSASNLDMESTIHGP